ncbi:MAG: efflux RND transporter periplasmic adaptor subunit [Pirellulales bacterium]|nr:efflux RND transporter periplasmic adaptor subunit [Pirellulales bacterium]
MDIRGFRPRLVGWATGVAAIVGVTLFGGCGGEAPAGSRDARPRVRVVSPVARQVTDYAYFTGRTEAVESVEVQARVTGYLESIDFTSGADVKKDQRLFKIDPRPYQAILDQATSQVALAESRRDLAIADYQRALVVAKTPGAISKQDVDKYAASKEEAIAAVEAARAHCESARLNVEFTNVLSPINGLAGRNLITVGNLVKQDQTLLTTVVSQDPIWVYFDVDEHTMLQVARLMREGKIIANHQGGNVPVQIGLADEEGRYPHEGHVDYVSNQVDASTGTIQVRGVFPNPPKGPNKSRLLTPGLFVRIRLPIGDPHEAILVPQAAVGADQSRKYVLVVDDQDVVQYRSVTLGPQQPDGLQVVLPAEAEPGKKHTAPLTAHDRVIVSGLQRVRPGMTVEAQPAEDDSSTASPAERPASIRVHPAASNTGKDTAKD